MCKQHVYTDGSRQLQREFRAKRVFIAHDYRRGVVPSIQNYRSPIRASLKGKNYIPLFADEDVQPGVLLSAICQYILDVEISVFDVTGCNANVLIELGIALGMNQPVVIIAQKDDPLPPFLQELSPLRYEFMEDLHVSLPDRLEKRLAARNHNETSATYCEACQRSCECRKGEHLPTDTYHFVGLDGETDRRIPHYIENILFDEYEISPTTAISHGNTTVCRWIDHLGQSDFALFHLIKPHHGPKYAPIYTQLGLAIGLAVPWAIIVQREDQPPTDLNGFSYITFDGEATLHFETMLRSTINGLLTKIPAGHIRSTKEHDKKGLVLFIDDEVDMGHLVQRLLERKGYDVLTATSGEEGIHIVSHLEPDIILLDILMPDIDGFEVFRRLRAISDVPIIFLTAVSDIQSKRRGLEELRADGYIVKLPDYHELMFRIDNAIHQKQQSKELLTFSIPGKDSNDSRPARILIIDDDLQVVETISRYLRQYRYEWTAAKDLPEGIRLATEKDVDLVLLDTMMPDLKGYQTYQQIKEKFRAPIIFMTTPEAIADMGQSRIDDYITKPIQAHEMLAKIKTILQRFVLSNNQDQGNPSL